MNVEELGEALRAVERELKLARKVYRASLFLYWAWVLPGSYMFSLILEKYFSWKGSDILIALSFVAILGFIAEERKAFKRVLQLEEVIGKAKRVSTGYILAQILIWPLSAFVATIYTETDGLWMLVFMGLGLLLLASVESVFTGSGDWRTFLAGSIILCSITFYTGTTYAIMVISFAFSLTAYLHLKRATRE